MAGLGGLTDFFEDVEDQVEEIRVKTEKAALCSPDGQSEQERQSKVHKEIIKIKNEVMKQDRILEQLETMEKLERMLVEIGNLMRKSETQEVEDKIRRSQKFTQLVGPMTTGFDSKSHRLLAEMKLKQFEELFGQISMYDPEHPPEEVARAKEESLDDSDDSAASGHTVYFEQSYYLDLSSRINRLKKRMYEKKS